MPATDSVSVGRAAGPALFHRYPGLVGRIPHCAFVPAPTPVEQLTLDASLPLWVKRDDHSCPLYGGNKPRKLEFVIGAALARRAGRLVTSGGIGTNHGLATTILGRSVGLATTLVLVDQPVTDEVRLSLRLFASYGAEVRDGRTVPGALWQGGRVLARAALAGERPFLVATGGSSPAGNLGFVSAGLELGEQVAAGALPEPACVFLPVGTGGAIAGLAVGLRLAGLATRPVGVLVSDILPPSAAALAKRARAVVRLLRRADPGVPAVRLGAGDFELATGQLGPGYGAATDAAREAQRLAAEVGLGLETTYTAKALAEVLARARAGALPHAPVLFWNTFSSVDVVTNAPPFPPERLPPRLRAIAEGAAQPR
ncbi:MAG: pyridoxal-phosphate dependent enzyme [Myxococcota bacterium]